MKEERGRDLPFLIFCGRVLKFSGWSFFFEDFFSEEFSWRVFLESCFEFFRVFLTEKEFFFENVFSFFFCFLMLFLDFLGIFLFFSVFESFRCSCFGVVLEFF